MTAFYNFRYGAYGPVQEGREYHITTFPRKGVSTMYLRLATGDERMKRIKRRHSSDYLADIRIEEEMFGSQTGNIEAAFSNALILQEVVVKDVILFGDVSGKLVERKKRADTQQAAYR